MVRPHRLFSRKVWVFDLYPPPGPRAACLITAYADRWKSPAQGHLPVAKLLVARAARADRHGDVLAEQARVHCVVNDGADPGQEALHEAGVLAEGRRDPGGVPPQMSAPAMTVLVVGTAAAMAAARVLQPAAAMAAVAVAMPVVSIIGTSTTPWSSYSMRSSSVLLSCMWEHFFQPCNRLWCYLFWV